jgi:hypothetical protein
MLNRDFREIISAFNDGEVDYLVVGAYAVAAHGLPRATGDIDLWIRPTPENAKRAWRALVAFGAPMERVSVDDLAAPKQARRRSSAGHCRRRPSLCPAFLKNNSVHRADSINTTMLCRATVYVKADVTPVTFEVTGTT